MRRMILGLLLILCLLPTSCGVEPQAPSGQEQSTLRLALFQGGFGEAYWKKVVEEFEATHPGVTINYMIHPQIGHLTRPAFLSGDVPDFLYHSDSAADGLVVSLIQNNALTDLTDMFLKVEEETGEALADQFLPGVLETPGYQPYGDGHIYLAPFSYGPLGLFCNQALFERNGWQVPETWDELFALGDLAREQGIALLTYPGLYPGYLESLVFPAIANAAGMDKLERLHHLDMSPLSEPEVQAALKTIKRIADEGYLLAGSFDMNHLESQAAWMRDEALFIPNGIWIKNEMHGSPRAEGFTFALTAVPTFAKGNTRYVQISYEQLSIPKNAKNPELAKEFLRFLYSDVSIRAFAEQADGVIPLANGLEKAKRYMHAEVYGMYSLLELPNTVSYLSAYANAAARSSVSINEMILSSFAERVLKGGMEVEDWVPMIQGEVNARILK